MIDFQYDCIINSLNEEMLNVCIDRLWPVLDYHFLKQNDIRRIDLIEKLFDIASAHAPKPKAPLAKGKSWPGSLDRYVEAIRYYFDNSFFPVAKGSKAEILVSKAKSIMSGYQKSENPFSDVEDLFIIYISLSRAAYPGYVEKKNIPLSDITCSVGLSDLPLLSSLRELPFEKAVLPVMKAVSKPEKQDLHQKNYAFINNVLLCCGLIQLQDSIAASEEEVE